MWSRLPIELIRRIVYQADLPIDTQLAFKIPPRKIHPLMINNMNNLIESARDGLVYNTDSHTLYNFSNAECHTIRRPVQAQYSDGIWFFNTTCDPHSVEMIFDDGSFMTLPEIHTSYETTRRVLLKGSGLVEFA